MSKGVSRHGGLESQVRRLERENKDMKEFVDSFTEELREFFSDGSIEQDEYQQMMHLYAKWYPYKKENERYRQQLSAASSIVGDLFACMESLSTLLVSGAGIRHTGKMFDQLYLMRSHLDMLRMRLDENWNSFQER